MNNAWQSSFDWKMRHKERTAESASRTRLVVAVANAALLLVVAFALCPSLGRPTHAQSPDPSIVGQWSTTQPQPYAAVHSVLLPNGKILYWPSFDVGNNPQLWDPATGNVVAAPQAGYNIFCAAHSYLANGQLLISGGDFTTGVGVPNATIYDPVTNSWAEQPNMNAARWYPTNTTLGNGDVLVAGGDINQTVSNTLPQVFQAGTHTWRDLTTAQLNLPTYSSMFMTDYGLVFNAGPNQLSRFLNPTRTGAWTVGPKSLFGFRDYGPSVMYDDGKILNVGGSNPPTETAEVIDINAIVPTWRYTQSMHYPRRQANATILPDGTVLVTGGSSGTGFDDNTHPVYPAELWNPATETWTVLASLTIYRGYHSTAALLPDGRVFSGGGSNASAEVYSPPYLFHGTRPRITSAPASVIGGQTFFVATPDAGQITAVNWISPAATTHTFNQNQRFNHLSFTLAAGGLNVTSPANANMAAPGPYMLFIINSSGVPSPGIFVNVSYSSVTQSSIALSTLNVTMSTPIAIGSTSVAQAVTVTNLGSSPVTMNGFTLSGPDFAVSSTSCGTTLGPNSSCQVNVVEQPTITGSLSETLSINNSDPASPQVVALHGIGKALKASPTSFALGTRPLGTTSSTQAVLTLKNLGTTTITINGLTYSNPEFANNTATTNCGNSLAGAASCVIYSVFTPNAIGAQVGTLSINSSDPGSPTIVKLSGTGTAVQLLPNHYTWGTRPINMTTTPQTITLTNVSTVLLNISGMAITGANSTNFAIQSSTCGTQVAGGASCSILVTFTPTSIGTFSASLLLTDDGGGSPQSLALGGTGGKGITSIAVTPASPSVVAGRTQQFVATATYSDGTTAAVTTAASWSSTNTAVASVGAKTGLATAIVSGTAIISATVGTVKGSTSMAVTSSQITLAPIPMTFAAQLVRTAGTPKVVTRTNVRSSASTIDGRTTDM